MTTFLLEHGSYFALAFILMMTGFGLPVPEEVPVVVAGVLASHGQINPWLAMAACWVGVLLGDCAIYWIGRHFGHNLIRTHRYWARVVPPEREAQIENMIHNHGLKVLFLARFLIVLRAPVYFAVGVLRMPFRRFLLIDVFCVTTVVGLFFLLSFAYGREITRWVRRAEILITVIVALAVLVAVLWFWRYYRRRHARPERKPEDGEE
ncbi:MAG: DedA family protein [Planctomycetota bacterium]|jgi:membrane protein DedA with SNARE-associated domain